MRRVPEGFGEESDIQARARSFRYTGARELLAARDLQSMLVAHHADDAAETFLFHAARGTGLDGLVALAPESDQLIRPLWHVSKAQIDAYARKKQIAWREDSSNAGDKYTRNHLRHHALPALREAMPQATEGLRTTLHHLRELQSFVDAAIKRESVLYLGKSKSVPGALVLYRDVLDHPHSSVIIWYILRSMGGFDYEAVRSLGNSQVGAKLEKGGWQLWAEREGLVLTPVPTEPHSHPGGPALPSPRNGPRSGMERGGRPRWGGPARSARTRRWKISDPCVLRCCAWSGCPTWFGVPGKKGITSCL